MARWENKNWDLPERNLNWTEHVPIALLMDIRDELREINLKLGCYRIQRMFATIERIDNRLKPKRKRK